MIFLEFNLPNATTWFYFSALLAVALFFKFSRLLSVRNLDVVSLFILVPGFLLILESGASSWYGYLWLFCGSGYFLARCLLDLALVRRPALSPNLNLGGLAWMGGALLVSLVAVAIRQPGEQEAFRKSPVPVNQAEQQAESLANNLSQNLGNGSLAEETQTGLPRRFWVGRTLAVLCHLAIVVGLVLVGWRHFQDVHAGMAAATFYLLLPYTYLLLPYTALHIGQWYHVWPAALLVWAVVCYRMPLLAGLLLGLAAGSTYFPVLVFPLWLSFYSRRGSGRFATGFVLAAGFCMAVIGGTLWLNGELPGTVRSALAEWQPWKEPNPEHANGFWTHVLWGWVYRLPVFIAYVAFVLTTFLWPAPKNLAHLLALTAAVLIGFQFWYADRGGAYVLWYLPFLLLVVFRPNLADRRPKAIVPETDWLTRLGHWLARATVHLFGPPRPLVRSR
jgi:hypothetical protein